MRQRPFQCTLRRCSCASCAGICYVITYAQRLTAHSFQEISQLQSDRRRLLIHSAGAGLTLSLGIFTLLDPLGHSAAGPYTQPLSSFALRLRADALSDPGLRGRGLIILFVAIAGTRLILTGLSRPNRRWSLIVGGTLLAVTLARELPEFLEAAPLTDLHAAARGHSSASPEPPALPAR
jgi:hypothetical protein